MTEQEIEKMAEERADTAVSTRERNIVYTTFIAGANAMQPEMEKLKAENEELKKGITDYTDEIDRLREKLYTKKQ